MRNFDLISEASLIDSAKARAEVLLLSMGSSILLYIGCPFEEKRHGGSSDWIVRQFRLNLSITSWTVNKYCRSSSRYYLGQNEEVAHVRDHYTDEGGNHDFCRVVDSDLLRSKAVVQKRCGGIGAPPHDC
jgi:hypothetical protein